MIGVLVRDGKSLTEELQVVVCFFLLLHGNKSDELLRSGEEPGPISAGLGFFFFGWTTSTLMWSFY